MLCGMWWCVLRVFARCSDSVEELFENLLDQDFDAAVVDPLAVEGKLFSWACWSYALLLYLKLLIYVLELCMRVNWKPVRIAIHTSEPIEDITTTACSSRWRGKLPCNCSCQRLMCIFFQHDMLLDIVILFTTFRLDGSHSYWAKDEKCSVSIILRMLSQRSVNKYCFLFDNNYSHSHEIYIFYFDSESQMFMVLMIKV